ncbi:MAG: hypothetical protein KGJ89_00015 [Patescibacteria group bacterium]|nr:hypothetical protein [Patescibacteria group bacterium]MDE2014907.1 hypothetical protein [Patescibacteria group bacterium]MDE2226336.1 hypothetical protein [Patescibacteria group bacterium]
MSKNKIIGIVVAVVAVVVIIVIVVSTKNLPTNKNNNLGGIIPGGTGKPSGPTTRESLPQSVVIVVPGANATSNVPQGVAVPTNVAPANMSNTTSYRNFNVTADGDKFTPDILNVYLNDQIVLNITAVDKDYDFTQPDFGYDGVVIRKGTTKTIHIQAPDVAKFIYYCKLCGGPNSGPVGSIFVAPRPQ